MTIVADFPDTDRLSLSFEEEICRLEQEAEDLQNQADLKIKQANMALEQVGIKRQQQARALKALVEAKQALKECLRLGLELGADAGPVIQREIAAAMDIVIAPPVVSQADDLPVTAFLYPDGVIAPPSESSLTPEGLKADDLAAFDQRHGLSYPKTDTPMPQTAVPETSTGTEVEPDALDPFDLALSSVIEGHVSKETHDHMARIHEFLNGASAESLASKQVKEPETQTVTEKVALADTPQSVELSHRMTYVSADQESGAVEHCYIGGANEQGLTAWGKWLTLSPEIASHFEVQPSTRIMKFKFELKLWGMSLAKLKILHSEGMLAMPPREKTTASQQLGSKLLKAK